MRRSVRKSSASLGEPHAASLQHCVLPVWVLSARGHVSEPHQWDQRWPLCTGHWRSLRNTGFLFMWFSTHFKVSSLLNCKFLQIFLWNQNVTQILLLIFVSGPPAVPCAGATGMCVYGKQAHCEGSGWQGDWLLRSGASGYEISGPVQLPGTW